MPINFIESNPNFQKPYLEKYGDRFLNISEMFGDTIQGENFVGFPSTFIRLQGCTLTCTWCDTLSVWKYGNPYSFDEIFSLFESYNHIEKLKNGQHLILTGGSPLKQQFRLILFLEEFYKKYNFIPNIEIENECTLYPEDKLIPFINIWNNSPKLSNSGMKKISRYKPEIIKFISNLYNSYFKFVISNEKDWDEIKQDFLSLGISKDKIVLMPEGQTREELHKNYEKVVDIAVRENIRICDRFHITIWDKKTGV